MPTPFFSQAGATQHGATICVPDGTVDDWNMIVTPGSQLGSNEHITSIDLSAKATSRTTFQISAILTDARGTLLPQVAQYLLVRKLLP